MRIRIEKKDVVVNGPLMRLVFLVRNPKACGLSCQAKYTDQRETRHLIKGISFVLGSIYEDSYFQRRS